MTTVSNALIKKLTEGSVSFKYRKIDGTIREATGTLNNELIPADAGSAIVPADTAATVAYYDLGANGWRAFRTDAVVSV